MILNVKIEKRVASYNANGEKFVCGNSGDKVKFTFDEEWNEHPTKTARFIWNKKYKDVEFTGDTCEIPVIEKTNSFMVGVYVGELAASEPILSTTNATIPAELSTRCITNTPNASSGENYTNEARGYAAEAQKAAERAERASMAYDDSRTYICTDPSLLDGQNGCWRGTSPVAQRVPDTIVVGYSADGKYDSAIFHGDLADNVRKVVILDCVKAIDPMDMGFGKAEGLETMYLPSVTESISPYAFMGLNMKNIYCGFPEGKIAGAPWGATAAEIKYNYKYREELEQ